MNKLLYWLVLVPCLHSPWHSLLALCIVLKLVGVTMVQYGNRVHASFLSYRGFKLQTTVWMAIRLFVLSIIHAGGLRFSGYGVIRSTALQ